MRCVYQCFLIPNAQLGLQPVARTRSELRPYFVNYADIIPRRWNQQRRSVATTGQQDSVQKLFLFEDLFVNTL